MQFKHYVNLYHRCVRFYFYPHHSLDKNLLFNIAFICCKVILCKELNDEEK